MTGKNHAAHFNINTTPGGFPIYLEIISFFFYLCGVMTTLIVNNSSAEARAFLKQVRSLPFVQVVKKSDEPVRRYKPAVERSMKRSLQGKGHSCSEDFIYKKAPRFLIKYQAINFKTKKGSFINNFISVLFMTICTSSVLIKLKDLSLQKNDESF